MPAATSDRIQLLKGDITNVTADAIVNAANSSLLGGGGVDGAIHRAGGPAILQECRQIVARQGGCATGEAVMTTAGNLPARFVIHTVGPVWNGGHRGEPELLANCYLNSLRLARERGLNTIAFPNISTGVYGYPKAQAAAVAVKTVRDFLAQNSLPQQVIFVVFDEENLRLYEQELA
ncbi:O-acetyl-ADP-ribose deacetylase [Rufibacter psychrotolerans]|uniref:O-acetyl-ADP-ribose deacetylase n=1 Tax=Rufibacter psychrotolerans TaxID=2812556 RepID=UPI001966F7F5|nr:O-acetyl-ADP-ribose deacetylase [Rufibacter sp. SYSU D00308]